MQYGLLLLYALLSLHIKFCYKTSPPDRLLCYSCCACQVLSWCLATDTMHIYICVFQYVCHARLPSEAVDHSKFTLCQTGNVIALPCRHMQIQPVSRLHSAGHCVTAIYSRQYTAQIWVVQCVQKRRSLIPRPSLGGLGNAFSSLSVSRPEDQPHQTPMACCQGNWLSHLDWDGHRCRHIACMLRQLSAYYNARLMVQRLCA